MRRFFGDLLAEARALKPRRALDEIVDCYGRNDLLTFASAISFRIVLAIIPLALFALGLMGMLGLDEIWRNDIAPDVHAGVSTAAFKVIDESVSNVLGSRQVFWVTAGALIAIWEMSSAMRAVMSVLDRIYDVKPRPWSHRVAVSLWLGSLVGAMVLAAAAAVMVLPRLVGGGVAAHIGGWLIALALLFAVVGLVVRLGPAKRRPVRWVSFGALLVVIGWIGGSLLYAWYVTGIADYGSIFGGLAVVIVTLGYLYVSSIVFLTGLQLDSLIRREVEKDVSPEPARRPSAASPRRLPEAAS